MHRTFENHQNGVSDRNVAQSLQGLHISSEPKSGIRMTNSGKNHLTNGMYNHDNGTSETMFNGSAEEELLTHYGTSSMEASPSGKPKSPEERQWFTKPVHLESKDYLVMQSAGLPTRSLSSVHRPVGSIGSAIASKKVENTRVISAKELEDLRLASSNPTLDDYVREYFPVTFGASYTLRGLENSSAKATTFSSSAKGIIRPSSAPWKRKCTKSPSRKRPSSSHSSSSSNSRTSMNSLEKIYLLTTEAPITGSSAVLLSSPYQQELAQLRMERLRIEEEHLLQVKRQEELERIRGPQKRWYEMKTPQFHYEAAKNNSMLQNEQHWQQLLDYRDELETASKDFQQTYNYTSSNGAT